MNNIMEILATDKKTIFIIDEEDFEKISPYRWSVSQNAWGNYIHARINGKWIYLHRFLMDAIENELVDHENRNRLDNRKSNLRKSSESNNSHNRKVGKNSESGIIGVTFHKRDKVWISEIMVRSERFILGRFKKSDYISAIISRLSAEKEYLGEFSPQRHLFKEYGID